MDQAIVSPFSKFTFVIGRVSPNGVRLLGSGFLVGLDGRICTTHHVVGNDATNLVIVLAPDNAASAYQNLFSNQINYTSATIVEIDPLRDIAVLKADLQWSGTLPPIRNFDAGCLGDEVVIFGYPHCTHGRYAFTLQKAEIGAKVLMSNEGIESKHAVINVQARPGQSGSPVVHPKTGEVMGMLVGAWVPGPASLRLGDINPYELHQTTHCISGEHIREML